MQAVVVLARPPIPPEQRIVRSDEKGRCDDLVCRHCQLHHHEAAERLAQAAEERQVQVGLMPMPEESQCVQVEHRLQLQRRQFVAVQRDERESGLGAARGARAGSSCGAPP